MLAATQVTVPYPAWRRDNILVGRGATRQSFSPAAAAASQRDVFYFPPVAKLPRRPQPDMPLYGARPPLPPPTPIYQPPRARVEKSPSQTQAKEYEEMVLETLADVEMSEKIHIIGQTRMAKFITYSLAGVADLPPPQLLTHDFSLPVAWGSGGRALTLRIKDKGKGIHPATSRPIAIPEVVGHRNPLKHSSSRRLKHIDNLIMCTSDAAIVPTLRGIRDSINEDTVICIFYAGMGIVEHLNQAVFPDPETRPTFVIGHSSHALERDAKDPHNPLAIQMRRKGRVLLSGPPVNAADRDGLPRTWDRVMRHARTQHFVKLLSQAPGLHATGFPWDQFLRRKLPSMIFSSITDSLSAALGVPYERLHVDPSARRMWAKLFDETVQIIQELPDLQEAPFIKYYFRGRNFHSEMARFLHAQSGPSPWIANIRDGKALPMHYLNGFFIRTAMAAGLSAEQHRLVYNMVRAKEENRLEELQTDIPLYYSPERERPATANFDPAISQAGHPASLDLTKVNTPPSRTPVPSMADAELEAIRKARLEQLKSQGGAGGAGGAGGPAGGQAGGQGQNQEAQKQAEAEARASILNQILHPEAADRLGRIRLVREDRATDVENRLIMLARSGQLRSKVTEDQLKELLSAVAESSSQQDKIVVSRRKGWDDLDDEGDDDFFD
ncbi:uncharacterized protein JN550_004005 [Neoarthrinium moseri]|uniref:uncharacterized protein n=1 Tax=Neoarthrinium moseri TaxID=1658444 RepID=UPI001FDC616B|nr:uncharacterized protein JN550_004005 [Neoarthrinium moseri]KAI1872286.1 hypothetical protein JN550_004005 [Neoarthrinium moseri]